MHSKACAAASCNGVQFELQHLTVVILVFCSDGTTQHLIMSACNISNMILAGSVMANGPEALKGLFYIIVR